MLGKENVILNKNSYNSLAFLNLIRLILAISIVLWHLPFGYAEYNGIFPDSFFQGLRDIVRYGGNQAFLLISGMLFYHTYYNKLDIAGGVSIKVFLIKRCKRIYPTAIFTCLFSYLIAVIAHFTYEPDRSINLINLIQDCLFLGARAFGGMFGNYNGPVWFLSALLFAYLLSCFIIILSRKKRSIWWFLIPMIVCFVIANGGDNIIPITKYSNELFNFYLGFFFMIFLEKFEAFNKWIRLSIRIVNLAIVSIFLFLFYKNKGDNPLGTGEMVGSLFCWIPLFIVLYNTKINILFDNKFFKTISGVTFYIYLWHMPIFQFIVLINNLSQKTIIDYNGINNMLIFFVILFAVSFCNYYFENWIKKIISIRRKNSKINL